MLSPEEYYRPTLARELRRQAEHLERRRRRLPCAVIGLVVLLLTIWLVGRLVLGIRVPMLPLVLIVNLPAVWLSRSLATRSSRLREEASELEQEHHARYGAGADDALA